MPLPLPLANTITPLIAANFIYLFLMNALIGLVEGKMLKRWFAGGRRAVWWMIAANYLSAWAGWFAVVWLAEPRMKALLGPRPIERVNLLAALAALITFAITIIIEFGFVHFATQRARRSLGHTLLATLCVNATSYVVVIVFFLGASFSLPFNAHVRPLAELGALSPGTLYWVDPDGQVIARHRQPTIGTNLDFCEKARWISEQGTVQGCV